MYEMKTILSLSDSIVSIKGYQNVFTIGILEIHIKVGDLQIDYTTSIHPI